jgi:hypothetical protein
LEDFVLEDDKSKLDEFLGPEEAAEAAEATNEQEEEGE